MGQTQWGNHKIQPVFIHYHHLICGKTGCANGTATSTSFMPCIIQQPYCVVCSLGILLPYYPYWATKCISATNVLCVFWPNLDAVLKLCCSSFRPPPCIFLPVSHLPCDCEKFTVTTHTFQCKCKWWINFFMLGFLIFVGLISLQSNQVCFF